MENDPIPQEDSRTPFEKMRDLASKVIHAPQDDVKRLEEEWEAGKDERKRPRKSQ